MFIRLQVVEKKKEKILKKKKRFKIYNLPENKTHYHYVHFYAFKLVSV